MLSFITDQNVNPGTSYAIFPIIIKPLLIQISKSESYCFIIAVSRLQSYRVDAALGIFGTKYKLVNSIMGLILRSKYISIKYQL